MQVKRYPVARLPDTLVAGWDRLLQSSGDLQSAFLSYAFCRAVDAVRGNVFVLYLKRDDGREAFFPFQYRKGRRFLGHAEKVGGYMSDYFGVVGAIGEIPDIDNLLKGAGISALRFDHAPPRLCPFPYRDAEQAQGCMVHTPSYSEFIARLNDTNRDFLKKVGRAERRMVSEHGACAFHWNLADSDVELQRVIDQKRSQYARTTASDSFAELWTRSLLSELARLRDQPLCKPILSTLYCGDHWVASHFALVCGTSLHSWYPVYNPQFKVYMPGHLLLFKMIERGCQEGITRIDFGEGVSKYKTAYRGEIYDLVKGRVSAAGLCGQVERIIQSLEWKLAGSPGKHASAPKSGADND